MNEVLRAEMERDFEEEKVKATVIELTKDREFIQTVAEQVKEHIAA